MRTNPSRLAVMVLLLMGGAGCDPWYAHELMLRLPGSRDPKTQSLAVEDAFAIVHNVARSHGLEHRATPRSDVAVYDIGVRLPASSDATQIVTSNIALAAELVDQRKAIRISIAQFLVPKESPFTRDLRIALVRDLRRQFGPDAIETAHLRFFELQLIADDPPAH